MVAGEGGGAIGREIGGKIQGEKVGLGIIGEMGIRERGIFGYGWDMVDDCD